MECRECKFWEAEHHPRRSKKIFGECKNPKFVYQEEITWKDEQSDMLIYWDYEGYSAWFETGSEFGCIHFEKRDD